MVKKFSLNLLSFCELGISWSWALVHSGGTESCELLLAVQMRPQYSSRWHVVVLVCMALNLLCYSLLKIFILKSLRKLDGEQLSFKFLKDFLLIYFSVVQERYIPFIMAFMEKKLCVILESITKYQSIV